MNKKNVLYMHTGSGNHGCEALVRTTAELLNGPQGVQLWSLTKEEDELYGSAKSVERIYESEEIKRGSLDYFIALFKRRILHQKDANLLVFVRRIFKNNIAIAIGGDNYCYEWSAKQGVELDKKIRKYCKKNVLWGCSINPEALTEEVVEDLKGYDLITARESITYNLLKSINPNTVQVADSAFLLEKKELPLPEHFIEGNTVGINVSPLIMKYGTEDSLILRNYELLIEYIIQKTDMNICLIPHVVWEYNNDREPIDYLFTKYSETNRICVISDGNCCELKGYISRCRFFVGARTHATIAAYSSYVPTLVVGYSVKSRGIARDLFGTELNYVLSVQDMASEYNLVDNMKWIILHEKEIKDQLYTNIPMYKKKALSAKEIYEEYVAH